MTIPIGKTIPFWILIFLVSCAGANLRSEGESQTRKLADELRSIETREELQRAVPRLKKRFNQIAELLIKARSLPKEGAEPSFASEELFIELARLYEMPGGRELIESSQREAIARLKH